MYACLHGMVDRLRDALREIPKPVFVRLETRRDLAHLLRMVDPRTFRLVAGWTQRGTMDPKADSVATITTDPGVFVGVETGEAGEEPWHLHPLKEPASGVPGGPATEDPAGRSAPVRSLPRRSEICRVTSAPRSAAPLRDLSGERAPPAPPRAPPPRQGRGRGGRGGEQGERGRDWPFANWRTSNMPNTRWRSGSGRNFLQKNFAIFTVLLRPLCWRTSRTTGSACGTRMLYYSPGLTVYIVQVRRQHGGMLQGASLGRGRGGQGTIAPLPNVRRKKLATHSSSSQCS